MRRDRKCVIDVTVIIIVEKVAAKGMEEIITDKETNAVIKVIMKNVEVESFESMIRPR